MVERHPKQGHDRLRRSGHRQEGRDVGDGRRVKCQWKADWAMRWTALGVDYEMAGKDLIDSVTLSSRICKALGGTPPEGFNYELFLDDKGEKISKSKGNGLTIEEWLTYASPESLSLFMFQKPQERQEAVLRRDPARGRRVSAAPVGLSGPGRQGHGSTIRSGTSTPAIRRRPSCRSRSGCCSTWWPPPTPTTRTCCGASSAATRRRPGPRRIRCSTTWPATRCATTRTS